MSKIFNKIVKSEFEPSRQDLWVKNGHFYSFEKNGWKPVNERNNDVAIVSVPPLNSSNYKEVIEAIQSNKVIFTKNNGLALTQSYNTITGNISLSQILPYSTGLQLIMWEYNPDTKYSKVETIEIWSYKTLKSHLNMYYAEKSSIPTKTSQLTNDSNFITVNDIPDTDLTGYATETWVKNQGYLTEHQDLSSYAKTSDIPTKTSDLTNDSGYITSDSIPTVPTKTSDLTNDSDFITSDALSTYATITELNEQIATLNTTIAALEERIAALESTTE